jgi:hypothetical protein
MSELSRREEEKCVMKVLSDLAVTTGIVVVGIPVIMV